MPIDFHDSTNAQTYASRQAHPDWFIQMRMVLGDRLIGTVADVGCGGGIYSRAWRELGACNVIGIDSSRQMIEDANSATDDQSVSFMVADAYDTQLDDASCDVVFSRAVVHHLEDPLAAMREAHRILRSGGVVIVQDRSVEDVLQPASPEHFRAHFFEAFPRLVDIERQRRPTTNALKNTLSNAGFDTPVFHTFWETRRVYQNTNELRADLLARTGRSILHELSDGELELLTDTILKETCGHFPLAERDRWTLWMAAKPASSR